MFFSFEHCAPGQPDNRRLGDDDRRQKGLDEARISYTLSHAKLESFKYRLLLRLLHDHDHDTASAKPWYITEDLWKLAPRGVPKLKLSKPARPFCRGVCALRGFDEILPHLLFMYLANYGVAGSDCAATVIVDPPGSRDENFTSVEPRSDVAWILDSDKLEAGFVQSTLSDERYAEQLRNEPGLQGIENRRRLMEVMEKRAEEQRRLFPISIPVSKSSQQ
jgi:hypothetical protein